MDTPTASHLSELFTEGTLSLLIQVGLTVLVLGLISILLPSFTHRKMTVQVATPPEAASSWKEGPILEKPTIRDPTDPSVIICYDPATGRLLGRRTAHSPADVVAMVARARVAQKTWALTSFAERRQVLQDLLDYVLAHQEDICRVASRDSGKTMVDGSFGEILTTCEKLRWTIKYGEETLSPDFRPVGLIMSHKYARVEYVPLGVVSAIVSWNYPFHNTFGPIISALFAGNAIVLKISEQVAWSAPYFEKIVQQVLQARGYSPDLVQFVIGFADAGEALIRSGVDKITFIGSPEVGKIVMRIAADNLTPVVLELGGKDCAIVCEDADIPQVLSLTLRGSFQNAGQNCVGLERIIVLAPLYDKFVKLCEERVQTLRQTAPLDYDADCGALTMQGHAQKIQNLIDDAVNKGARALVGGKMYSHSEFPHGQYYPPTLLVDVTPDMDIAQNEVFGPVMVIMKARDDNHAVELANSSKYGLGSSVFSLNTNRAESISARLRTGMCNINDFGVNYLCQSLPFGGVGISGFDRFAGPEGLRGNCLMRSITSDRFPGVRTSVPKPLAYPVPSSGFAFSSNLVKFLYSDGMLERAKAALELAQIGLGLKK